LLRADFKYLEEMEEMEELEEIEEPFSSGVGPCFDE